MTHASPNLFSLLGLQLPFDPAATAEAGRPAVVISHDAWRRDFARDPDVAGRVIHIGNRNARIAGVLPYGVWRLPDEPDAWLLEPDSLHSPMRLNAVATCSRTSLRWDRTGCMAARFRSRRAAPIMTTQQFYGVSFAGRLRGPWGFNSLR